MKRLSFISLKKVMICLGIVTIGACSKKDDNKSNFPLVEYYISAKNMSIRQVSYTTSGNKTVHLSMIAPEYKMSPFSFDSTISKSLSVNASGLADSTGNGIIRVAIIVNKDTVATNSASGELASTSATYMIP
ncbi:hypothetical protein [Polluticaenibacter yanchengensis]|uniref:DUF4843 domain-containing protein n=1 Tax=Polluticaenibacter yanchengensis TaxID=3014562 RepID=A0ABT4UIF2_9BACT|nr:hypothetical protein [Chitinophagaceae bacterium LY-5]